MRIWYRNHWSLPLDDAHSKGLGDVAFEAACLEEDTSSFSTLNDRPADSILVDLAVREDGILRFLREYGPVDFLPLSDADPIFFHHNRWFTGNRKRSLVTGHSIGSTCMGIQRDAARLTSTLCQPPGLENHSKKSVKSCKLLGITRSTNEVYILVFA